MLKLMLGCCKLYISESRSKQALEAIERAAKFYPEAAIVNKFEDEAYNRVGYTLVARLPPTSLADIGDPLPRAVFALVSSALEAIDLRKHLGTHPRLGVVDHICFHPLADASLGQVAGLAKAVAAEIGVKLQGLFSFPPI